jgi:hypothetical protein
LADIGTKMAELHGSSDIRGVFSSACHGFAGWQESPLKP